MPWSNVIPSHAFKRFIQGTSLPTLPPLIATGYVQKIMCPAFWCIGVFPQQHAPGMVPPWVWLYFFVLPKNIWLASPTRNLAMNPSPSPDMFQNYHRPVCFSWKIHRCWCYSFIIPCADQKYMTHQSARKFSHGPLPHFWEPTPTWWQSWVVFTFACILGSLQLDCPKRLCWQTKNHHTQFAPITPWRTERTDEQCKDGIQQHSTCHMSGFPRAFPRIIWAADDYRELCYPK